MKRLALLAALTLVGCATARPVAVAPCAAICEARYGKPMPAARVVDGACSCLPDVIHLTVTMRPMGWLSAGEQPPNPEPSQPK